MNTSVPLALSLWKGNPSVKGETYTADVYKGSSPPSDELIVARVVWELKNKKGTIQEALNDDTPKKQRIISAAPTN
jgi:hypothetical protein